MSHGGIRQAMHSTHDIALLAAYMAAVVHDLEHKGADALRMCVCVCACPRAHGSFCPEGKLLNASACVRTLQA
eukprot:1153266-Pelagomonas_calceolata.AAC.2